MSVNDSVKLVDLLIEKYSVREKRLSNFIAGGKYAGGKKITQKVLRELEGQRHEVGHFVHDLEQLRVDILE